MGSSPPDSSDGGSGGTHSRIHCNIDGRGLTYARSSECAPGRSYHSRPQPPPPLPSRDSFSALPPLPPSSS
jgi:hypothetical protein